MSTSLIKFVGSMDLEIVNASGDAGVKHSATVTEAVFTKVDRDSHELELKVRFEDGKTGHCIICLPCFFEEIIKKERR